MWEKTRRPNRR
nr:unnamed protein product [Callosobruchus chinensis]